MRIIKNYYFKILHDEKLDLISGYELPDPEKGPYHFIDCEMHPRVWEALQQLYTASEFTRTYYGQYS